MTKELIYCINCKFFDPCGSPSGGCKHPSVIKKSSNPIRETIHQGPCLTINKNNDCVMFSPSLNSQLFKAKKIEEDAGNIVNETRKELLTHLPFKDQGSNLTDNATYDAANTLALNWAQALHDDPDTNLEALFEDIDKVKSNLDTWLDILVASKFNRK